MDKRNIGAHYSQNGMCDFTVWGPACEALSLFITFPEKKEVSLFKDKWGYWTATVKNISADTKYFYKINDKEYRPDPGSMYQPDGPHKESKVFDNNAFKWTDNKWQGIPLGEMIIYELHVGTFSLKGSIDSIIPKIGYLKDLGINAIELMPIAQFPGQRNWGYDGTYPFAVHNSYGNPDSLKQLINECHSNGIAVILDVVYNHFGPEGCYLREFAPYYTQKYKTPWGDALNFDDAYSYGVRNFVVQNALYWFKHFHIDALRLDAIHGIFDASAKHILQELAEEVEAFSDKAQRKLYLIAESDLNDSRIIRSKDSGGYGIDAQWSDDFHHSVHAVLTGEEKGYYEGFNDIKNIVKSLNESFVYSGNYSSFRKRVYGNSVLDLSGDQFVVSVQNHDQIGNRMLGERLSALVPFEGLKLAAGCMLISPYIPLLFMGEEYGETNPFLYFISHSDDWLIEAVRNGRKDEFKSFGWEVELPDPFAQETFEQSKLDWEKLTKNKHKQLLMWYKNLIKIRKGFICPQVFERSQNRAWLVPETNVVLLKRENKNQNILCIMNFSAKVETISIDEKMSNASKIIDSYDKQWGSIGRNSPNDLKPESLIHLSPYHFALYGMETNK
ncbi:MAG: malto-oligosyltrehalose trehalohydrolase [Candidatus Omnitrophica bacterium]|nr:malto-oligosyltrehalose trehalohydrolase [Candidatus Omnitrophota bacterium]